MKTVRDKIKELCDDYKVQSWNMFRHFHNELNDLTEQLLKENNGR